MGIERISPHALVSVTTIQAKRKSMLPDLVKRMFDTGELNRGGCQILPTCAPVKAGCTCARSAMVIPTRYWDGLWIAFKIHTWSNGPCGWHIQFRGGVPNGLVFHADRGTQFTSEKLWKVCRNLGLSLIHI